MGREKVKETKRERRRGRGRRRGGLGERPASTICKHLSLRILTPAALSPVEIYFVSVVQYNFVRN